jgi:hypothetical protein
MSNTLKKFDNYSNLTLKNSLFKFQEFNFYLKNFKSKNFIQIFIHFEENYSKYFLKFIALSSVFYDNKETFECCNSCLFYKSIISIRIEKTYCEDPKDTKS